MKPLISVVVGDGVEKASHLGFVQPLERLGLQVLVVHRYEDIDLSSQLVIVLNAEEQGLAFNKFGLEKGLTWLPVQFAFTNAQVGPIIIPGVTACFECMQLRSQSHNTKLLEPRRNVFELSWMLVGGVVGLEAVKWVTRDTNGFAPLTLGHVLELDAFHFQGDLTPVYKVPTCPQCGVRHQSHLAAQPWREAEVVKPV